MFSRFQKPIAFASRQFSTSTARNKTVAVMGASGGDYLLINFEIQIIANLTEFNNIKHNSIVMQ